jgi:hypothetical protein
VVLSYGGGTQTVAIVVLVAMGRLPRPGMVVMADTGREASETWEYAEAHVVPLLARLGLRLEVAPHSLAKRDLYAPNGDLMLPAVTAEGRLPTFCSGEWKQRVVRRHLRAAGVGECDLWIGISKDEVGRAKDADRKWIRHRWPLLFDVPLTRAECRQVVIDYELPPPPRSSCWCCPHRRDPEWRRLRDHYPADWLGACELDQAIRERDQRGGVWLHRSRLPLAEAPLVDEGGDLPAFGAVDGCDSGFCWI